MEHRRADLPIDQIASHTLAQRIITMRANDSNQVLFSPAAGAALLELAARAARTAGCSPGGVAIGSLDRLISAKFTGDGDETYKQMYRGSVTGITRGAGVSIGRYRAGAGRYPREPGG
jgi:hypothetical protein